MKNLKKLALLLALALSCNAVFAACSATTDDGSNSNDTETNQPSDNPDQPSDNPDQPSDNPNQPSDNPDEKPDDNPNLPVSEVKDYTLFVYKEGVARLEAEDTDVTHYVKSSDNATIVVERADASGGKFLAAATGNVVDGQYFEFKIDLSFNATITMTAAYAQTNKWKDYDEDMTKSYTYIIDENRNMRISPNKTVLAARADITKWETFTYTTVTLPAGEHSFRVKVAENTGKGNPNIDYFDFDVKGVAELPDGGNVVVPANDFHTQLQYEYLNDPDYENVEAYANGVAELSRPNAITLDFSEDVADSSTYVIQYSDNAEFANAVTVSGLSEKKYGVYNLKLGQKVYWRGGVSKSDLENAPVHEMTTSLQGPRNIYIDGISNVRDIGGYSSYLVEGGTIRQGLYYRGARPDNITQAGKQEMLRLGIKTEIDLRDSYQCIGPYVDGIDYYAVSIPSGTESTRFEAFAAEYKQIFTLIANAGEAPVYLHCTAGADRTGICTFILLTVCGAEYEDIARDYLFTNFSTQGSRVPNYTSEFKQWWAKLDNFAGDTKAEKAKAWLISKGITAEQVETIRKTFVEGYGN